MSGQLYEQRAQLESRAPLALVTTLEIDDIPTVELTMNYNDGQKKKVKAPTHDLKSLEQVLFCFQEFLEAARKLHLDGVEWFDYYRDTLHGHERTALDLIATAALEVNRNEEQFWTAYRSFVSTIVDEAAHRLLMDYLQSTVKPWNISVMEVVRRVQILCMYAEDLPTESGQLPVSISDEDKRKTLFYNMIPENWTTTFTRGDSRIATMSIAQMAIYCNGLCALEGGNKNNRKKRKNDDDNNSRSNRQRSGRGRVGNRNNRYYSERKNNG